MLDDGNVWFNNLAGPEAGILDRDGVALRVLKYETEVAGKRAGGGSGVGVTDDPNGLQVDVDPTGGDVASDRKAQDGAAAGEGTAPARAAPGEPARGIGRRRSRPGWRQRWPEPGDQPGLSAKRPR